MGIPAVEANSIAGRLLSIVFAGEIAGSAGDVEELGAEVCMRG